MKRFMRMGKAFALVSAFGLCFPQVGTVLHAAEPTPTAVPTQKAPAKLSMDVVVNAAGELRGAAVNPDSAPCAKAKVTLRNVSGKDTLQTSTDAAGRFVFQGVRPGAYGLTVNGDKDSAEKIVRVWAQDNAPPAATPLALVPLEGKKANDVVRGQEPGGDAGFAGGEEEGGLPTAALIAGGALLIGGAAVGIVAIAGGFSSNGGGLLFKPASP